jgi:hypothetical protein
MTMNPEPNYEPGDDPESVMQHSMRHLVMEEIERRAADVQKADRTLTRAEAIAKAVRAEPILYAMYSARDADRALAESLEKSALDARRQEIDRVVADWVGAFDGDPQQALAVLKAAYPSIHAEWIERYRERR